MKSGDVYHLIRDCVTKISSEYKIRYQDRYFLSPRYQDDKDFLFDILEEFAADIGKVHVCHENKVY